LASSTEFSIALGGALGVPPHAPIVQVSSWVQPFPSSHAVPVSGTSVQMLLPLHVRRLQASLVQVIAVPPHIPDMQTSS
jgi:hypothetical protein